MSIHFISGKPGGGKSLYAMRLVVERIGAGGRVITNLPIKLGELNEYLQKRFPAWAGGIHDYCKLLNDDEAREFYRWRWLGDNGFGCCDIIDGHIVYPGGLSPVLYVVDEVHQYFNAREWAKTGKLALWYLSQHRKYGDDVVCVTQAVGNVDKQFRVLAQDFTYMRNLGQQKFWIFRGIGGRFLWRRYLEPETATATVFETGTFKIDVAGVANCYDTAAGVGVLGGGNADRGKKQRGLPMSTLLVALLAVALVAYFGGRGVFAALGFGARHVTKAEVPIVQAPVLPKVSEVPATLFEKSKTVVGFHKQDPAESVEIELVGLAKLGGKWVAYFDDGSNTSAIQVTSPLSCIYQGKTYRVKKVGSVSRQLTTF